MLSCNKHAKGLSASVWSREGSSDLYHIGLSEVPTEAIRQKYSQQIDEVVQRGYLYSGECCSKNHKDVSALNSPTTIDAEVYADVE
jgi:hypothetical protein